MISPPEWDTLCLLIEEAWPYPFDDTTAKAWRLFLDDYTAAQVLAAVKACVARGMLERPSVSALVAEIRRDPSVPTWAEAYTAIFGRGGVLKARTRIHKSSWEIGERARADDESAWEHAGELHHLIGAFIREQGLDRLRSVNLDDFEYGAARRKQLADEWAVFVEKHETRDIAALDAGRRGELVRFDPLRALPWRAAS